MCIKQCLTMLVLPVAMLITGISHAAVMLPAVDIQNLSGDAGADLGLFNFNIDATAFLIVTDGDPIDIPDEIFTLSSSTAVEFGTSGYFSGTFSVGDLLLGEFTDLYVRLLPDAFGGGAKFSGDVTYTGGSMMSGLTGGRIEGAISSDGVGMVAKLGEVAVVPVPAAVWLFGSGLLGLVGIARRKV
jgi:hypothetical protein